jgi:hypothetical protein
MINVKTVKSFTSKVLLVLASTLAGLLISEGIVRLLPQGLTDYNKVFEGDPLLGVPPAQPDISKDFPEKVKPKDVYRIVALGDSHTAGSYFVPNQSTYPEVLESLLNGIDLKGKRVEVYNAAGPGHSHYQYYLYLDRRLRQYDPDLVIVGYISAMIFSIFTEMMIGPTYHSKEGVSYTEIRSSINFVIQISGAEAYWSHPGSCS